MPFTKVRSHKLASRFAGDLRSQQQELTAYVGFGERACIQEDQPHDLSRP